MYLYPTKVGIEFIEWTSKKFNRLLKGMQYVVITSGYILMAGGLYLIYKVIQIYFSPGVAEALKVPVIFPLIPYLPELFHLDFLPSFPFTYWIVIIAIIAVSHEFAHGIFARVNNIKIHSTGFGFLGPFLAAFVEPDEKQMEKKGKKAQLSVLAAGTFANVIMTILFGIIMWLFFISAFSPAGVQFTNYDQTLLPLQTVYIIDGIPLEKINVTELTASTNTTLINVTSTWGTYSTSRYAIAQALINQVSHVGTYDNSPAFNARLNGAITSVDDVKITSFKSLDEAIFSHKPGDNVTIKTINVDTKNVMEYNITLRGVDGQANLGVKSTQIKGRGLMGSIYNVIAKIKNPLIYYESDLGTFGWFIYNLLWWTVLINLSVALVNMLPIGMFDGGRFFYLTVLGITKSKKVAMWSFKISTWLFLAILAALMAKWVLIYI